MTLRDDLLPCVDDARQIIDDLGLRPYTTIIRTRTWAGGRPGLGATSDVDVTITPKPRVTYPTPRQRTESPGRFEDGDRLIEKISALTYSEADLTGDPIASDAEVFFLIDGEPHRIVGKPEKRNFEWRVQVRRMNRA